MTPIDAKGTPTTCTRHANNQRRVQTCKLTFDTTPKVDLIVLSEWRRWQSENVLLARVMRSVQRMATGKGAVGPPSRRWTSFSWSLQRAQLDICGVGCTSREATHLQILQQTASLGPLERPCCASCRCPLQRTRLTTHPNSIEQVRHINTHFSLRTITCPSTLPFQLPYS